MSAAEQARELHALSDALDDALEEYRRRGPEAVEASHAHKLARANHTVRIMASTIPKPLAAVLEAMVFLATADLDREAEMSKTLRDTAKQAIDVKKQRLMAVQGLMSLEKAEAQLSRYESRETAGV